MKLHLEIPDTKLKIMKVYKEVLVKDRLPDKEGVYHTIESTGFTDYNEKTYFNGKAFVPNSSDYEVKCWLGPIEVTLKSEEILPKEDRDNDLTTKSQTLSLIRKYHEALEVAEKEIIMLDDLLKSSQNHIKLLNQSADERYNKALEYVKKEKGYSNTSLKIAAYGE